MEQRIRDGVRENFADLTEKPNFADFREKSVFDCKKSYMKGFQDPETGLAIVKPTYRQVALYRGVQHDWVRQAATKETISWHKQREEMYREELEGARAHIGEAAEGEYREHRGTHLERIAKMQNVFDKKLDSGDIDVTVNQSMDLMALEERLDRNAINLNRRPQDEYVKTMINLGLFVKTGSEVAEVEVIEGVVDDG